MILKCSAGHIINTEEISLSGSMHKRVGDKCGMLIRVDRLAGNEYCQRRLKEVKSHCLLDNKKKGNENG